MGGNEESGSVGTGELPVERSRATLYRRMWVSRDGSRSISDLIDAISEDEEGRPGWRSKERCLTRTMRWRRSHQPIAFKKVTFCLMTKLG